MQTKYKIISKLINGEKSTAIAAELDVPYTKVLRYKREFEKAEREGTLAEIVDIDAVLLMKLMNDYKESTPEGLLPVVEEAIGELTAVKSTADALAQNMQIAAATTTDKIKVMVGQATTPGEIEILASALCALQNAFFNKNSTQVLVQNIQNDGQPSYGSFLSDKPNGG